MELVYVAFGSNVEDREGYVHAALERLRGTVGVEVLRVSRMRETDLVGDGPAQGRFLNGVVELKTSITPVALLSLLQSLERLAGREFPHTPNHPRELDLDIILFGDRKIDSRDLVVPHPRAHQRDFVLDPLRDLGVDVGACFGPRLVRCVRDVDVLSDVVAEWLAGDCRVGLVPTMGGLHEGHASLMRAARAECDRVITTIFVNPLQFGSGEDFSAYPRDLDADLAICSDLGVDLVFAPSEGAMFGENFCSYVAVGQEAEGMEGAMREGHFGGVATVVARLFALTRPHRAYFGEKDAQQVAVIRRMVRDLGFPVEVVPRAIVRESDGLALSSRNIYLTGADRKASTILYRALCSTRDRFRAGVRDRDELLAEMAAVLATEPRCLADYIELRCEDDLRELPPGDIDGGRLLVAARFKDGERVVRLLDNMPLTPGDERA